MSTIPDFSWMAVGSYIHVGPSEVTKYREAAELAGVTIRWEEADELWLAGAIKGTRIS